MRERGPAPEQKAPQSEILRHLVPDMVPGSTLTIYTGRTNYSIRVDDHAPSGDPGTLHIGGTVIDAAGKIPPGVPIHFFCPVNEAQQTLRLLLPDNKALVTSAVRGFSLERAPVDVNAYRGERWKRRFETEPTNPKRGMRTLISLFPEHIQSLETQANHLEEPAAFRGLSREEHAQQEAQRREWAEGARQQAAWLRSAHEFLRRMLAGDQIIPWQTVVAHMPGWKPEHVQYMMGLVVETLEPQITSAMNGVQRHMTSVADTPDEALAQQVLRLRDARAVLEQIQKDVFHL